MTVLCTKDLHTHCWQISERTMLSTIDCEGFYSVFFIWRCQRCDRCVWADGVIHHTTRQLSPVEWEEITRTDDNPWQRQVEVHRRQQQQAETVKALIQRWTT